MDDQGVCCLCDMMPVHRWGIRLAAIHPEIGFVRLAAAGVEDRQGRRLLAAAGRGISGERTVGQELLCAGGDRRSHAALLML